MKAIQGLHHHRGLELELVNHGVIGKDMVVVDYEFGFLFLNKLPFETELHQGKLWIVNREDYEYIYNFYYGSIHKRTNI